MKPRVLALCAGYGGLELAIEAVEGEIELVAYAEYDDAPARIMAHHHPGVTNLRDVTKIDWPALLALGITIMTAGYPCQPFSHAGKRQGEDDPRHLWPHIAKGIGILRPALCVFENVRGHLSLGFDQVLADLDGLGYDVRYYMLRAADVGAAHGRARLFIFAEDRARRGPAETPLDTPVAYTYAGKWWEQADLFGPAPFGGKLPHCGLLHEGVLYAEPRWTSRDDLSLLPTPSASQAGGTAEAHRERKRRSMGRTDPTCTDLGLLIAELAENSPLLPTPAVNDMGEGKTVEAWDAWTDRMKAEHGNGNGHGKSLAIEAQRLLPTPRVASERTSRGALTREGHWSAPGLAQAVEMAEGVLPREYESWDEVQGNTPQTWGDYAPAIARWETVIGRPAPAPTEPGTKGGHRLSPRFVEWLMGLPDGHVCDVPDITRNQALKALGNGVVWQQAAAAYRAYLTDTEKEKAA